ncbi:MAG: 5'-nucleotidase C-terminal domain-containing protein [Bacteroidales bacterium]|nr:5'-nucleotidase C-terminal domain-containing protein [Bacteroidales bacterium]
MSFLFALLLSVSMSHAQQFTILHTNDMHSRLLGYAPTADYSPLVTNNDSTLGGFARIAGYFEDVEKEIGADPLILDAGDFLMGTLFHTLEAQEGFELRLMKSMGYDAVSIGNHEFDFGISSLAQTIQRAADNGPIPPLLLSNIQFNPGDPDDDSFQDLYKKGLVHNFIILNHAGLKIGFFGLMGDEAATVAPYAAPAAFTNRFEVAADMTKYLRESEKVDLVICLSHCGLVKGKKGKWESEDVELAKKVEGIDLIISGHSHTHLFEPLIVNDIPIVQTGSRGTFVGRLDLDYSDGHLKILNYGLKLMDDKIKGDAEVQHKIEDYQKLIIDKVFTSLNLDANKPIVETDFDLLFNQENNRVGSNLGPLVADALHWYVNQTTHNDVTLAVAGLIRDEIKTGSNGEQLVNDLFRVVPLGSGVYDKSPGYSMAQIFLTGKEIKNILEAMLLAPKISTDNYAYWSGVRFKYNPNRIVLDQVYEVSLGDRVNGYHKIDLSNKNKQLYTITTNNYVLEFFGIVKQVTFGLLKVVPKDRYGNPVTDLNELLIDDDPDMPGLQEMKEWAGFITYLSQFPDINGNGIPDIPDYYKNPIHAGERKASLNPVFLWGSGNGIMGGVSLATVSIAAAVALVLLL